MPRFNGQTPTSGDRDDKNVMREAYHVPETKHADELLRRCDVNGYILQWSWMNLVVRQVLSSLRTW